jgi:alpha/beta superfamily hydrolase
MRRLLLPVALVLLIGACTTAGGSDTVPVGTPPAPSTTTTTTVAVTLPPGVVDLDAPGQELVVPAGNTVPLGQVTAPDVVIRSAAGPDPVGGEDFVTDRFQVGVERGIVYTESVVADGTRELLLDVYSPRGDERVARPGFIAIHGGGFVGGSRLGGPPATLCRDLAARGHVCASIEYRLVRDEVPGEGPVLPRTIAAAVDDAAAAVEWMRTNADDLGVSPNRISIGGSSAGSITALLTAFTVDGIDLHRVVDLWGGMYDEVEVIGPDGPPVFIVHGVQDRTVSFLLAEQLMDELSMEGVPFVAYPFAEEGHGVPLESEVDGEPLLDLIAQFVGS